MLPPFVQMWFLPQKIRFLFPLLCPLNVSRLYRGTLAEMGDWHVPPAFVIGYAHRVIVLHVDHRATKQGQLIASSGIRSLWADYHQNRARMPRLSKSGG